VCDEACNRGECFFDHGDCDWHDVLKKGHARLSKVEKILAKMKTLN
jgi:hypothetical protein